MSHNKQDPKKVLLELQQMVGSDIMKAAHYMKQGVKVALVAGNKEKAEELAAFHVELNDLSDRFEKSYRKIVD